MKQTREIENSLNGMKLTKKKNKLKRQRIKSNSSMLSVDRDSSFYKKFDKLKDYLQNVKNSDAYGLSTLF